MERQNNLPHYLQVMQAEQAAADALPPVKKRRGIKRALFWGALAANQLVKASPANTLIYIPSIAARVVEMKKNKTFDQKVKELASVEPEHELIGPAKAARIFRNSSFAIGSLIQGLMFTGAALETFGAHISPNLWAGMGLAVLISATLYFPAKMGENLHNGTVNEIVDTINKRRN